MTTDETKRVNAYCRQGMGYKKIATLLGLPENTVKTYLRRHPQPREELCCQQCGGVVERKPHKRLKKFCTDACRLAWWHEHQDELKRTTTERLCTVCGATFSTHKASQKYCSRACYGASMRKESADNDK